MLEKFSPVSKSSKLPIQRHYLDSFSYILLHFLTSQHFKNPVSGFYFEVHCLCPWQAKQALEPLVTISASFLQSMKLTISRIFWDLGSFIFAIWQKLQSCTSITTVAMLRCLKKAIYYCTLAKPQRVWHKLYSVLAKSNNVR